MRAVRRASVVDWRERNRADNSSSCDKRTDTFDTIRFCLVTEQTSNCRANLVLVADVYVLPDVSIK